jgi:hypothetical protein
MQPEHENFEELRRLLVLKRYEQPPPGYFNDFSRKIIARIEAGESEAYVSLFERWLAGAPWLLRMFRTFERQPILAGAFGMLMCGIVVSGVVYSDNTSANTVTSIVPGVTDSAMLAVTPPPPSDGPTVNAGLVSPTTYSSSTAGAAIVEPASSLFSQIRLAGTASPADFSLSLPASQH